MFPYGPNTRCLLALAFGTIALACSASDTHFYVGASGGQSNVVDDLVSQQAAVASPVVDVHSVSDRTDHALKGFAGYRITPNVAIEAAYADLGDYTHSIGLLFPSFGSFITARRTATAYGADVVGSVPLGSRLEAMARLGAYVANVKTDRCGFGIGGHEFSDSHHDRNTVMHGGLGVQAAIGSRFKLRLEWERFFRTGTVFALQNAVSQGTGRTDMDLWSVGASISF